MKPRWSAAVLILAVVSMCASAQAQLKGAGEPEATSPGIFSSSDLIEKFLFTVDHLARTSDNPTASAIAAALQVNEILKDKPQEAIDYFNRALPDVKNDAVRRVIRLQLTELYRKTNQPDKALEQIRELMILAPAGPAHTTHTPPIRELPTTPRPKESAPND